MHASGIRRVVGPCLGVLGAVVLLGGVVLSPSIRGGSAPARIVPESRRIVAREGLGSVTATFHLENPTRSNLVIRGVKTGCGCSVASIERDSIPPVGRGKILIQASVAPGVERSLDMTVEVDAPERMTIPFRLTVLGTAPIPHVADHTPSVQFGDLGENVGPTSLEINTRERAGSEPWISDVRTSVPEISVTGGLAEEQPPTGGVVYRTYRYELKFDAIPAPGRISGRVDCFDKAGQPIPMDVIWQAGYVRSPVTVVPPILFATAESADEPPRLQLQIARSDSGKELRAELVEGGDDVIVEPLGADGGKLDFSIRPVADVGERRGDSSSKLMWKEPNESRFPCYFGSSKPGNEFKVPSLLLLRRR